MKHTFVLHVTFDTGDLDPSELMDVMEEPESWDLPDGTTFECVDAFETSPEFVG